MAKKEFIWRISISTVLRLIIIQSIFLCLYSENRKESCIESERAALLTFKAGLNDRRNILSSWQGEDCCRWRGVACNNKTGHVVGLNLRSSNGNTESWLGDLSGEFSPSLLNLTHLRRLDLSLNNFTGSPIPEFFGSFENLRYLNLSGAGFTGQVPPQFGNLSRLLYLDLHDYYNFPLSLHVDNLRWLQHLSSLKYLDLTQVNLTAAVDWLHIVNMLPSLTFLKLVACELHFIPSHLPHINFTALNTLDLSFNNFNSTLPQWLGNISSLINLNLGFNSFYGPIPDTIGNLISLEVLNLEGNNFNSTLPQWLGNISSLTNLNLRNSSFHGMIPSTIQKLCNLNTLDLSVNEFSGEIDELVERHLNCTQRRLQILRLSENKFSGKLTKRLEQMVNLNTLDLFSNQIEGPVPTEIGKLLQLTELDLGWNSFKDVVTEAHFANLTRLKLLVLSNNPLNISLDESWAPTFQLEILGLGSCLVGPLFPAWLQHQKKVSELDLSSSGISGTVPEWFWNYFPPFVNFLDLSNNQISGKLPEFLDFVQFGIISLASNLFEGPLPPSWPHSTYILDLSNNSLSGPLPSIESPELEILDLSSNHFNSNMPSSWSKASTLSYLDLSDNNFSGGIPNEWPTEYIEFVNLGRNHLTGRIPSSFGSLTSLQALGLSNNSLSGMFPASLRTCKTLTFLDLSQNKFYGNIPTWLGESFPELSYLLLRSNMFSGSIPPQLMQLHSLQILDLAENNLSGAIPYHLGNLSSMASTTDYNKLSVICFNELNNDAFRIYGYLSFFVFTKGEKLEYSKNGYLVTSIDLSDNHLRGEIPDEIGDLIGLMNLNLSSNQLEGKIPEKIGRLQALESLDLSRNELSGNIPLSLSFLSYLSHLNLSYNHLSGEIPSGNQLQTLNDPSIYVGNIDLCGPPLSKNCSSNNTYEGGNGGYDDDGDEMVWLYLGMGLGYVVGFWAACGVLLFKKTWRYAYFRFFDNIYDQLYVVVFLTLNKLKRARMDRN